jgi:hypothetical protein
MNMKFSNVWIIAACLSAGYVQAQDEGAVVKKERIERDKGLFVGGGISILGGDNLGNYSNGINFEGGFTKRMNRIISLGASLGYQRFAYDPAISSKPDATTGISKDVYYDLTSVPPQAIFLTLTGGDVSMISLAANIKFNFVPIKDNSVISVYAFAKPFVASATVASISGYGEYYEYDGTDWIADPTGDGSGSYNSETSITGGIYVGPGIEINPAKPVSFFLQASFGYTFPLDVVSTQSYSNDLSVLQDPNSRFPLASLGFTSINFAAGISFNLD